MRDNYKQIYRELVPSVFRARDIHGEIYRERALFVLRAREIQVDVYKGTEGEICILSL